jgi:quinoprotein glucose dehydrogenase
MPAFAALPEAQRRAVAAYVLDRRPPAAGRAPAGAAPGAAPGAAHAAELAAANARPTAAPYQFAGYERWRDAAGYPAVKPPWGTLSAIDLNTGAYRWRIPLGDHPAARRPGDAPTGTEQYGGPIVTAGGLVFVAATQDARIRAFDKDTGRLLWEAPLPAPGYATPSTYMVGGRQYLVVAAGGGKLGSPSADVYVAFALPR